MHYKGEVIMKNTLFLAMVLILAGAGLLFSAGQRDVPDDIGPIELHLWHQEQPPHRQARFQEVIDAFNEENPDITVIQTVQTWGEAFPKTISALQAGRGPDMLFVIPGFAANIKNAAPASVQPVDDMLARLDAKYDIFDAAISPYDLEGNKWAVPIFGQVHLMYYNKAVYREAGLDPDTDYPRTWDDLWEHINLFIDKGITPYGIGIPASATLAGEQFIYSLMASNNAGNIYDNDGNLIFNNPNTVEAYRFWKQLYDHSPPGSLSYQWFEPQSAMFNDNTAFAFVLGGKINNWETQSGKPPEDLGAAFIPVGPNSTEPGAVYYSNATMVLTEDQRKQQAIEKFLEFVLEPEMYGHFLAAQPGLFLPVTASGQDSTSFWDQEIISKYADLVELQIKQSEYGKLYGFNDEAFNPAIGRISELNILARVAQKIAIDGWTPERAVSWGEEQMKLAEED